MKTFIVASICWTSSMVLGITRSPPVSSALQFNDLAGPLNDADIEKATAAGEQKEAAAPFPGYVPVRAQLEKLAPKDIVNMLISREDGLNHLLLSDVNALLQSVAHDFPDLAKVYSVGKSFEGRDINVIELDTKKEPTENNNIQTGDSQDTRPASSESQFEAEQQQLLIQKGIVKEEEVQPTTPVQKHAFLMTGATHARELISTSFNVYELLQLLQQGAVKKDKAWEQLLNQNKYIFMPIFNVDGVAYIEDQWQKNGTIAPDRKNMNTHYSPCLGASPDGSKVDQGVDLNRNFAVDFGQMDPSLNTQLKDQGFKGLEKFADADRIHDECSTFFPGPSAFSEPETQAFRSFLNERKDDLAFVLNVHSNGNSFIYPFNGRQKNDIEERRPGILKIFTQISENAPFPVGELKGTSKEVMGQSIGGDQDDWTLAELGIPSATAELGYEGEFIDEWRVRDAKTATDMLQEQSKWVEYIYQNLPQFGKVVDAHKAPAKK